MSYQAGVINSATPATAIMAAMDAVIQAHPAWDFVEQVVNGVATARVYKNDKNISGLPNDFYVIIWRPTDAGTVVNFSMCETWDAVGKLMVRYAPQQSLVSGSGSYVPINADGSVGPTGQAFNSPHVLAASTVDPLMIGNIFPYYLSVTNHRIAFAMRNVGWVYAGAYESLPGYNDPYPIVLLSNTHCGYGTHGNYNRSTYTWGRCTSYNPTTFTDCFAASVSVALETWSGSFTRQWRTLTQSVTAFSVRPFFISGVVPRRALGTVYWNYREPLSQRWYPSRVGLNQAHSSLGSVNNDCRGLLRDVMALDPMDGYPANGDSMSIEGVDHVCMTRGMTNFPGEHFWVSKAA